MAVAEVLHLHPEPCSWVMEHTRLVNAMPWHWLLTLVLATLVQFVVGGTFYRSAWSGLKHGSSNMSVLVVLGTTAAYLYSCISMVGAVGGIGIKRLFMPDGLTVGHTLMFSCAQLLAATDASYMGMVYFDSSMMIITFVCAGEPQPLRVNTLHT